MARVKIGPPLAGLRGTIGGITFSANRSATYAKRWAGPRRIGSRNASHSRCILGSHGTPWRDLAQATRDAWDAYAADPAQQLTNSLGQTYYASGWNWFVTLNSRLTWIERPLIDSPPVAAKPSPPSLSAVILDPSGGADLSAVEYPVNEFDGWDFICFGRLWLSQGAVARTAGFYRILETSTPGASSTNIQSNLEDVFGDIPPAARLFVSVSRQDAWGQRSTPAALYGDS